MCAGATTGRVIGDDGRSSHGRRARIGRNDHSAVRLGIGGAPLGSWPPPTVRLHAARRVFGGTLAELVIRWRWRGHQVDVGREIAAGKRAASHGSRGGVVAELTEPRTGRNGAPYPEAPTDPACHAGQRCSP